MPERRFSHWWNIQEMPDWNAKLHIPVQNNMIYQSGIPLIMAKDSLSAFSPNSSGVSPNSHTTEPGRNTLPIFEIGSSDILLSPPPPSPSSFLTSHSELNNGNYARQLSAFQPHSQNNIHGGHINVVRETPALQQIITTWAQSPAELNTNACQFQQQGLASSLYNTPDINQIHQDRHNYFQQSSSYGSTRRPVLTNIPSEAKPKNIPGIFEAPFTLSPTETCITTPSDSGYSALFDSISTRYESTSSQATSVCQNYTPQSIHFHDQPELGAVSSSTDSCTVFPRKPEQTSNENSPSLLYNLEELASADIDWSDVATSYGGLR